MYFNGYQVNVVLQFGIFTSFITGFDIIFYCNFQHFYTTVVEESINKWRAKEINSTETLNIDLNYFDYFYASFTFNQIDNSK